MPHDCNKTLLKKGDVVRIFGRVEEIYADAETCNLSVEVIEPGHAPQGTHKGLCLTASLVQKLEFEPCRFCGEDSSDCACADMAEPEGPEA